MYELPRFRGCIKILFSFLAILKDGAALLFTTGLIGIFGLWSFRCAFNVGGEGFFCVVFCVCVCVAV